ncbi:hypothetical protein [Hafnia paralvei]|uniref:hypothetical protein n=1 Tax=Hafnia paralvei TaxID=546367 RepID=UPI0029D795AB|nr:hypothetical protein [Hafnia paralvei]MDX6839768.1 hypothetical protein [Hafnia paralvei]
MEYKSNEKMAIDALITSLISASARNARDPVKFMNDITEITRNQLAHNSYGSAQEIADAVINSARAQIPLP